MKCWRHIPSCFRFRRPSRHPILHDPKNGRFRAVIGAVETPPIVVADATSLFGGPFDSTVGDRLDAQAVYKLLDAKGVSDPYIRQLALVALKRAAKQASGS